MLSANFEWCGNKRARHFAKGGKFGIASHYVSPQGVGSTCTRMRRGDGVVTPFRIIAYCVYCTCDVVARGGSEYIGLTFNTTNVYDSDPWSTLVRYKTEYIDPDLFLDGTMYVTSAGTTLRKVNLPTGKLSRPVSIWYGTAGGTFLGGSSHV
jgi:hypothetical protein